MTTFGEVVSWEEPESDFRAKISVGSLEFREGIVDKHIGNWKLRSSRGMRPSIIFYKMNGRAQYDYYIVAKTKTEVVIGLTEQEAKIVHASLLCNPLLHMYQQRKRPLEP